MHIIRRLLTGIGLVALAAALLPLAASAHEHREVGNGQYELTVGFLDEPAFASLKNGLDLRVEALGAAASPAAAGNEEDGTPVEGLAGSLQAEVIYGDQTMSLEVQPRFGEPGAYRSVFFPMAEGDYSFHIFGEIEGVAIDETFTSSPDTFASVQPVEPLQFPKQDAASANTGLVAAGMTDAGSGNGLGGSPRDVALALAGLVAVGAYSLLQRRRRMAHASSTTPLSR